MGRLGTRRRKTKAARDDAGGGVEETQGPCTGKQRGGGETSAGDKMATTTESDFSGRRNPRRFQVTRRRNAGTRPRSTPGSSGTSGVTSGTVARAGRIIYEGPRRQDPNQLRCSRRQGARLQADETATANSLEDGPALAASLAQSPDRPDDTSKVRALRGRGPPRHLTGFFFMPGL